MICHGAPLRSLSTRAPRSAARHVVRRPDRPACDFMSFDDIWGFLLLSILLLSHFFFRLLKQVRLLERCPLG